MNKSIYEKTAEVYNKLGKNYLEESKKHVPKHILSFSKMFKKNDYILDIGCGGGRDTKFFTDKGLKAMGIDTSSVLIKLARKEALKAKFQCVDILNINFPKNTFNGVWAQAVLLHLKREDVPVALKNIYKVLKPGGTFYLKVRKGNGEEFVKEELSGWNERFYTYFSKKEMENLLKKQGFKITHSLISSDRRKRKGVSWITLWAKKPGILKT